MKDGQQLLTRSTSNSQKNTWHQSPGASLKVRLTTDLLKSKLTCKNLQTSARLCLFSQRNAPAASFLFFHPPAIREANVNSGDAPRWHPTSDISAAGIHRAQPATTAKPEEVQNLSPKNKQVKINKTEWVLVKSSTLTQLFNNYSRVKRSFSLPLNQWPVFLISTVRRCGPGSRVKTQAAALLTDDTSVWQNNRRAISAFIETSVHFNGLLFG